MARAATAFFALLIGIVVTGQSWSSDSLPDLAFFSKGVLLERQLGGTGYLLYAPTSTGSDNPLTVLVGLGGIGDVPEDFAANLVPQAEQNGWLLVVPKLAYGDWLQLATLTKDDQKQVPWLNSLLGALPDETSLPLRERVLLYGFSRGGQSAHRFALAYPRRVLSVATMSGGTYTLPIEHSAAYGNPSPLKFPFGVSDLASFCGRPFDADAVKRVDFWVGVGEKDNAPGDVPRPWDPYLGATRLDRAKAFAHALSDLGARVHLSVFPKLGHQESAESRSQALDFLRNRELQWVSDGS